MYKLLAIDIDDTLITDEFIVTEPTKAALAAAIDAGVIVTLATGRMYASAEAIAKQLELDVPLITYQGALVKHLVEGTVLYERNVPEQAAKFVIDYANEHDLLIQAYVDDQLYVSKDNEHARNYSKLSKVPYIHDPQLSTVATKPSAKLLFIDDPDKLDRLAVTFKHHLGDEVHMTKSKPNYFEVTHREATKGHAIKHLAAQFGIDRSQIIAIGDSWNDLDMIEFAGLGVAMKNGVDDLKQIADYITLSNNEDGVKHVIEKFILQA